MHQAEQIPESRIDPPSSFSFPFSPYEIQKDFMRALFTALQDKKLGIFESPTGTGKSLSMLCGALTWLEAFEDRRVKDLQRFVSEFDLAEEEKAVEASANWITAQHELRKKKEVLNKAKRELVFLEETLEKRRKILQNRNKKKESFLKFHNNSNKAKQKVDSKENVEKETDDNEDDGIFFDDFALDNYSDSDYSGDEDEDGEEPEFHPVKIIFSSRTHSQLSQFVKELKRTSFSDKVTTATLGSRQNLCINPEVTKLRSLALINEKCLDLQKSSKGKKSSENKKLKTCSGCPYFGQNKIEDLKTSILAEPMDIEELVKVATEEKACPYYASRKAAKDAQLILMPYNTILHTGTRAGVGIKTENSVLLLDEAHNIMESISNMYSTQINLPHLKECLAALEMYIKRYMSRFSAKNLLFLKQLKFIMKAMVQLLEKGNMEELQKNLFTLHEFRTDLAIDNLDMFALNKFCEKYRLIFKLKGYIQQQKRLALKSQMEVEPAKKSDKRALKLQKTVIPEALTGFVNASAAAWNSQSIINFAEFLKSLRSGDAEGRIIIDRTTGNYKFLLLNVASKFKDLISSARSIILAGGTMKPHDEVMDTLFSGHGTRISVFSCDHVIPEENLVCLTLTKGPRGTSFDFTFKNRNSTDLLEELCQTLTNVVRIVPGGVVVFLPSYEYEGIFHEYLQDSSSFDRINSKKKIFREPKDGNCETVLADYTRQVRLNPNGALLFAVVGGKLSEGINFSDDLGRCVIVVGLPYPNITSVEIQEKVRFATDSFGKEKGDVLLTNMCSKAVNQSVGRAIRHANDYAAIVLIDQRFARSNQQALLPDWIQQRSQICINFGQAVSSLGKFFAGKRQPKS